MSKRSTSKSKPATVSTHLVKYTRAEDGWWTATIPSVPGCLTQGRTLVQASERIRKALALAVDGAESAKLEADVELPEATSAAVREAKRWRELARMAKRVERDAAIGLARLRMSLRDVAFVLGTSVSQVYRVVNSQDVGESP